MQHSLILLRQSAIVALGGFLMGFDVSVIAGVVGPIREVFSLSDLAVGWSVASLTLSATLAMLLAGPASDRFGRLPVLRAAAALFAISAVASALAPDFFSLVIARLVGGFGVGAALIVAPIYIGESAPPARRGVLVSINQLNIVIGISAAFFSNYFLVQLGDSRIPLVEALGIDVHTWRWMLGVESLPAVAYFIGLLFVHESPRWLALQGKVQRAREALTATRMTEEAEDELTSILASVSARPPAPLAALAELFQPKFRRLLGLCLMVAILQQLTGINAVFFYAPMIFEQAGLGQNAALWQAALVGLVNLLLTIVAMALIDRVGRRPLLLAGLLGMSVSLLTLAWAFADARAAPLNTTVVLWGILAFVGSFAVSLGPVMWVLLSELMPTRLRGVGVSLAGVANSGVSFIVQLIFPWQLATIGAGVTFALFGGIALLGLLMIGRWMPETRGRSLEELGEQSLGSPSGLSLAPAPWSRES